MKTSIRALAFLWSMAACVAFAQPTAFPGPNENIWLVADKLQYGTVPQRALGTNTPTAGQAMLSDGTSLYWGTVATAGGTTTNLTVQNFNVNTVSNYQDITFVTNVVINNNLTVQSNATFNSSVTIQTNLTVNQNFVVKGQATLNTVIITNTTLFSTNAFPLAAGTTWDWSRYSQFISTNADFNVGAITGLSNNLLNQAELQISNAGAGQIICHLLFALNKIGPLTTNDIYLPSHKQAYVNGSARGIGTVTNIVTITEQ